jgi:hypothetical protein
MHRNADARHLVPVTAACMATNDVNVAVQKAETGQRASDVMEAVEMAASIFRAAWWPIHVAVAWALTRDRAFVERSSRAGKSLLGITVVLAIDNHGGTPTRRYFEGADDTWSALREEMAAGKVRASGTPFWRADLQGIALETNEIAREIAAVEIGTLRLQDDGDDKDCLVPEDWRVAHGSNWNNLRGYRNVQVFRDDLFRAFSTDDGAVPYVPDWERLPDAVKRVMATGVKEDQASKPSARRLPTERSRSDSWSQARRVVALSVSKSLERCAATVRSKFPCTFPRAISISNNYVR